MAFEPVGAEGREWPGVGLAGRQAGRQASRCMGEARHPPGLGRVEQALEAHSGSPWRLWPYQPERARPRLLSEAKQGRACVVLGWETAWEHRGL